MLLIAAVALAVAAWAVSRLLAPSPVPAPVNLGVRVLFVEGRLHCATCLRALPHAVDALPRLAYLSCHRCGAVAVDRLTTRSKS